jgi:hypothetical protein
MAGNDNVFCNGSSFCVYIYIYIYIYIYTHIYIYFFPSSHAQLIVHCKIGYMLRPVQAIIRPITIILLRKIKIAIRSEISHLLAVLFFFVCSSYRPDDGFSRRNMSPIVLCIVNFVLLTYLLTYSLTHWLNHSLTPRSGFLLEKVTGS